MSAIALRVRLVGGDQVDVSYDDADLGEEQLVDHVISTLGHDHGVLRCRHGDRLVVLFGRGVAMVEVSPRGAVL